MSNGPSPSAAGPSNAQPLRIQQYGNSQNNPSASTGAFSFSVHQPYTNWPLHASVAPYTASWYPLPPQSYGPPRAFKEAEAQTEDAEPAQNEEGEENKIEQEESQPEYRRHWDVVLAEFLRSAGLYEALDGLKNDMVMMNENWERNNIPRALEMLSREMQALTSDATSSYPTMPLDKRKFEYINAPEDVAPQSPSTVTKSISRLLAASRKRNNASNRAEFLQSAAEKRRKLNDTGNSEVASAEVPGDVAVPSCARTDARPQNRELQMKYDIVKNEDGPLKRTVKRKSDKMDVDPPGYGQSRLPNGSSKVKMELTAERHPGLAARFTDIETHLAVRYVPSPPHSLLDRIKYLEDHIMKVEKEHPPWAALHFNQPNRGWPPPPRLTPIIVPSHLTSSTPDVSLDSSPAAPSAPGVNARIAPSRVKPARPKSSLHRAVMEKLEIQRAIGDLSGAGTDSDSSNRRTDDGGRLVPNV